MSDPTAVPSARGGALQRATEAYRALAEVAEQVEDEWQYTADLQAAYLPALENLATGPELVPAQVEAVDAAIAEVSQIADPHRAIDWLSTFPHVVALAVGSDLATPASGERADERSPAFGGEGLDEIEDSPFRVLRQRRD